MSPSFFNLYVYTCRANSSSRRTLQAVAVDTPLVSSIGAKLVDVSRNNVCLCRLVRLWHLTAVKSSRRQLPAFRFPEMTEGSKAVQGQSSSKQVPACADELLCQQSASRPSKENGCISVWLRLCETEIPALFAAANAKLMNAVHRLINIMTAAQDTGMAELCAEIVIAQVCVSIEMYDVKLRIFLHNGTDSAQCDKMLAA